MGTKTPLERELLDAADLAEDAGRKTGTLDSITEGNHFAAKLRARAARVRELEAQGLAARPGTTWLGPGDLFRALTGPLSPAGPSGGDGERETKET